MAGGAVTFGPSLVEQAKTKIGARERTPGHRPGVSRAIGPGSADASWPLERAVLRRVLECRAFGGSRREGARPEQGPVGRAPRARCKAIVPRGDRREIG